MQTTITIELKFDADKQRVKIIRQAARVAARTLLTTASLVATARRPTIAVHSDDYFDGEEEIKIDYDSNEFEAGGEEVAQENEQ